MGNEVTYLAWHPVGSPRAETRVTSLRDTSKGKDGLRVKDLTR